MGFPREIPVTEYVQAIPEVIIFLNDMKWVLCCEIYRHFIHVYLSDVLSFYKEELAGENDNRISLLAARNKESHLKVFESLSEIAVGHYKKIVKILEGSPSAYEAFKHLSAGYIDFHLSSERYKFAELHM